MRINTFFLSSSLAMVALFTACNKAPNNQAPVNTGTLEQTVIKDFVNNVALAQYGVLTNVAVSLNGAVTTLDTNPTEANLLAAQTSWKATRQAWEQCEGFLFGPVEDNDYDPNTDTWPTDYVQLDSLLASANQLQITDVAGFAQSLRGYHPLEYVIFGHGDGRTAAQLTPRLMAYAVSLSGDMLYNNIQPLYQSWTSAPVNYAQEVLTAGSGSTKFPKKQDLFLAIVSSMSDICNEVGTEKMYEPFINHDSSITESPYSGNTLSDFRNNVIGLKNVYLGLNGGTGIKDLVASKNKSLDNQLQAQITSAISSFANITVPYEEAIFTQRQQVQQTMTELATLKDLIDDQLKNFIIQYVQD